ncbi:LuxR C-terminal-related transcriptional regulator [Pelomonas sp. UHG3]|uniref:LuxR C-terminal-related transcriptional regulator n=1 Tax=Roseateles hydrophilus TaxID=2975054 RepID=A0ACC6C6L7_9BURK|nr:LuxR C-terminal-related transcriptional regulator [Pelomonas sp. UHG3]MCY4744037.1 LuxR C-terminal-related transcriptional regulator [Pelomonas sp. UHG3]
MPHDALDYRSAFQLAPVGLVLSVQRQIVDCNERVLQIFGATRKQLLGCSFAVLYPSAAEFERTGARIIASLDAQGHYADDRVMRRVATGEPFWCHVTGRALDPTDPHARGIWSFEDLSARRQITADLTPREREIAALLVQGHTSKLIGRQLGVSPRTVDIYRGRLMKKYQAGSTPELIHKLLSA